MSEKMTYKGYTGSVRYSVEDECYVGKVQGISGCLLYEGGTKEELQADFQATVDGYLDLCKEIGKRPQMSKGGES